MTWFMIGGLSKIPSMPATHWPIWSRASAEIASMQVTVFHDNLHHSTTYSIYSLLPKVGGIPTEDREFPIDDFLF